MAVWRRLVRWPLAVAVLWLLFAYLVAPPLIAALYRGDLSVPQAEAAAAIASARRAASLAVHLASWRWFAVWPVVAIVAGCLFARLTLDRRVVRRQVMGATPTSLAGIRVLVCATALLGLLQERVATTALLPRAMLDSLGLLEPLRLLPGFASLVASPGGLRAIELLTTLALGLALVGWRTRVTLPVGAAGAVFLGALLRAYSRLFHGGLVPLYLLVILCFTPCADALSLDARRRRRRAQARGEGASADAGPPAPETPRAVDGWARWACWATLALVYLAAGLSKLRSGGLMWWHPDNLRDIVYTDSLNPMAFDFDLGLRLASAPDAVFALLGLGALVVELAYPAVLVSRHARRLLPAAAIALHVGILLLQNVAFFDLALLQLMFYDVRLLLPGGRRRAIAARATVAAGVAGPAAERASPGHAATEDAIVPSGRWVRRWAVVLLVAWAVKLELYPLSAMQMYAARDTSGQVRYLEILAEDAAGRRFPAPLEQAIPALADSRYRWALGRLFSPGPGRDLAVAYLRSAAAAYNRRMPPDRRLISFDARRRRWDFRRNPLPSSPRAHPGETLARVVVPVAQGPVRAWMIPTAAAGGGR